MRPSVFPLTYSAAAISVNYATSRNTRLRRHFMNEYRLFALKTHIDHLYLDPSEEFVTFMVDLGTHYQCMGEVLSRGQSVFLAEEQVATITTFIDEFMAKPDVWLFLLEDPEIPLLKGNFETKYTLYYEGDKLYVNLSEEQAFTNIHTDLLVSIFYTLAGMSPTPKVAHAGDLLQPLLVSPAPLVV